MLLSLIANLVLAQDVWLQNHFSPNSGIKLSSLENVTVLVNNNSGVIMPSNTIQVNYTINGGATVSQMLSSNLTAGASWNFTFSVKANLSVYGTYVIKVWVVRAGDVNQLNDTLQWVVQNDCIVMNQPQNMTVDHNAQVPVVNFTSSSNEAAYFWTNTNPAIGLSSSGIGDLPSFTAINKRGVPVTSTITVTPKYNISNTFSYTGNMQTFVVPAGVTSIRVDVKGSQGESAIYNQPGIKPDDIGGKGGRVTAEYPVTPGQTLYIFVGGIGYNGGGNGGGGIAQPNGGGASDIRMGGMVLANRIIVAGGGGGGGNNCSANAEPGGAGGGLIGGVGFQCGDQTGTAVGQGGTQSTGGAAGTSPATAGILGIGGDAGGAGTASGGGGGGYYGGGGAAYGGGGGGSSYTDPLATSVQHTQGFQEGLGEVIVSYDQGCPPSNNKTFNITINPTSQPNANGVLFVKKGSTGTGNAWNNAIGELADALVVAKDLNATTAGSVAQIWVAGGTYKPLYSPADNNFGNPAGRDNAFLLIKDVKVYGGFDPDNGKTDLTSRNPQLAATILSGDIDGNDVLNDNLSTTINGNNSKHVVISANAMGFAELNGFTISGGNADASGSLTVNGENVAGGNGGGIVNINATLNSGNLTIAYNKALAAGAGIFNYNNAVIRLDQAQLTNNVSAGNGGGIFSDSGTSLQLANMVVSGNMAGLNGGGICDYSYYGNSRFTNMLISGNTAVSWGGGMYIHGITAILTNLTIAANTAGTSGGAVLNEGQSPSIYNSIILGNSSGIYNNRSNSTLVIKNSLVQEMTSTANNNISATGVLIGDVFVAPLSAGLNVGGDYHLKIASVGVNAGDQTLFIGLDANTKDLAGNARLKGVNIDLGAYELQSQPQHLTFAPIATVVYGTPDFDPGASSTTSNPITYVSTNTAVATIVNGKIHTVGVGSTTVKATQAASPGYDVATAEQLLTITAKPVMVSIRSSAAITKVYDGTTNAAIQDADLTLASGDIINGDNVQLNLNNVTAQYDTKHVGMAKEISLDITPITLNGTAAGNYSINKTTTIIRANVGEITVKPIIVTATAQTKVYGEADPLLAYTSSPTLVAGDSFSGGLTRAVGEAVGGYPINIGTLSLNGNYAISYTSADLTITKKQITVTAAAKSRVFGGADPALTYSFSPALGAGDSFIGSLSRTQGEDVGNYPINIGSLSLNGNYTIVYTGADLNITRKTLTITADAKHKAYGEADPVLTYTSNGLIGLDVLTGSLSRVAGEDIGAYAINKGSLAAGINYEVLYVSANLTIAPRMVTITATAKEKTYGDADPMLTYKVTGLLAGDVVNGAQSRTPGENVGAYPVNKGTLSVSGNYTLNYVGANLTINKKVIMVTAIAKSKTYGDTDPALAYTASPTLLTGDSFVGTLNRSLGENAGTYQIGQGTLTAGGNYTISYQAAPFIIEKAVLLVTANNAQLCQGTNLPSFTLRYSGFRNGDNEGAIVSPAVGTNASNSSPAGSYALIPSGGSATNYSFSYANGVLTINGLPQVSISSNRGDNISRGETLQLTASGGAGYIWNGPGGIVSGQNAAVLTIRPTVSGTYTVKVTNASGCSSEQSFAVTVRDDFQAISATNLLTPNGDGINDVWKVENIDVYPNNEVMVFDRAGRVLYRKKGYDNSWNGTVNGAALTEGTYYYVIDFGNGKLKQKGFITLIREGR